MLYGSGLRVTGGANSVTRNNISKNIVLISDDKGNLASSTVSVNQPQEFISSGSSYSKAETDSSLLLKAYQATTYTQQ